jgi:soluble lytic murein transglycosylase
MNKTALLIWPLLFVAATVPPRAQQESPTVDPTAAVGVEGPEPLAITDHRLLPRELSRLWFAPTGARTQPSAASALKDFSEAMKLFDQAEYAKALPILSQPALQQSSVGEYAQYYAGVSELRLDRPDAARRMFQSVLARPPAGYLAEAAAIGEAEAAEALADRRAAIAIYERLSKTRTAAPDDLLMRLGNQTKAAGDSTKAAEAFGRVYFEFPTSQLAPVAGAEYNAIPIVQRLAPRTERYKLELGRAEQLFGARRYADARSAFQRLRPLAEGDDRELADIRIGESEYFLRRWRQARDGLRPYVDRGPRRAEAAFYYAMSVRSLGDHAEFARTARRVANEYPTQSWAEEALNSLATHLILQDDDAAADVVFRELYKKYPKGRYAERAAWKIGWRAYRERKYEETPRFFDRAAADFPRSDYRPTWLYWSGRAHEALKESALARERFTLVVADYHNSYYGRLAVRRLKAPPAPRVFGDDPNPPSPSPNEALIRVLLTLPRYEEALNEIRYAQRTWGDRPALQATIAWIYQQQGLAEQGNDRFTLLRGSITIMRRAYPQFMAAGGEGLPREVLTIIFPLAYWDLIQKYSSQHNLDRYLVSALMAQESTFVPDVRSSANAVGLMQLMAPTARQYARRMKIPYSSRLLTNPDANVRIGTAYLADKIREFGGVHLALASYNAGETAVRRWIAERPDVSDRDEFIDDIPYPETQNYVKRILGTAEDYRRLYGS